MATANENAIALASFNKALELAIKALPERANDIKIVTALDLMNRIVEKTPVDTGRARGNWQLAAGTAAEGEVANAEGLTPSTIMHDAEQKTASVTIGEDIWISNNLPYIEALEEGHSLQAPHGMVALSLAESEQGLIPL